MGNLSELILRRPGNPTPERLHQAEAWAKQALVVVQKTRKQHEPTAMCEFAYAAALFNVGMMREVRLLLSLSIFFVEAFAVGG